MRPRFLYTTLAAVVLSYQTALANPVALQQLGQAKMVGSGRLSVLFWDIYDATLYAPPQGWSYEEPFMLSLRYLRHIRGDDIADRSVQEMRDQGFKDEVRLATWHTQMKAIFPDVHDGSTLSALFVPGERTDFFAGETPIGSIQGEEFARLFSGIWLSEHTSEPQLRKSLLGK